MYAKHKKSVRGHWTKMFGNLCFKGTPLFYYDLFISKIFLLSRSPFLKYFVGMLTIL